MCVCVCVAEYHFHCRTLHRTITTQNYYSHKKWVQTKRILKKIAQHLTTGRCKHVNATDEELLETRRGMNDVSLPPLGGRPQHNETELCPNRYGICPLQTPPLVGSREGEGQRTLQCCRMGQSKYQTMSSRDVC